ncbi:MAG: 4-hydroxy-tetrahydrodipicolinate synthase [Ruminococcaceae bacterium]|nr:4-hydroxy-tetrahydrodipicolinate synthase [Oscillospiraceae bacterium]
MKEILFEGSACALVTPFKPDTKDVDLSKSEELCEFQIRNGTQALVVCGTTGEAATLTYEERCACIRIAVETASKKIPVIAGTGSNNTETAVRLSNEAEKEGVDGLLIVTPFYNKASQDGIIAHYEYIAQRVSVPIIVYNVPSRTGVDIKPQTYAQLSKIRKIVGIKEANGNISSVAETMAVCKENIAIYSGNDDQIIPIMALGGKGVISVAANVIPRTMRSLVDLCRNENYKRAAVLQKEITPLEKALFADVNPIPVKELMSLCGFCENTVRLPLTKCNKSLRDLLSAFVPIIPKMY